MEEQTNKIKIHNILENGPVLIYGAHLVALELYRYLKAAGRNFNFIGFAVTSPKGNPTQLDGQKVAVINSYSATEQTAVLIAMPEKYHKEAEDYARKLGFTSFLKISLEEMSKWKGEQFLLEYKKQETPKFFLYEDPYDSSWLNMSESFGQEKEQMVSREMSSNKDGSKIFYLKKESAALVCGLAKRHYKFPTLYYLDSKTVIKETEKFDFYEDYRRIFGIYHNLHTFPTEESSEILRKKGREKFEKSLDQLSKIQKQGNQESGKNENPICNILNIYMVFSQWDSGKISGQRYPDWIRPIQAGSILSKVKAHTFLDETGDNVSEMNGILAEMTAAYWIWKNAESVKYKGLCHYRRHFVMNEEEIMGLAKNGVDVILTTPRYTPGGVGKMFLAETPVKELAYRNMIRGVGDCHPEDRGRFEKYLEECLYCPNNMVIARSEIYDDYCTWIFPVLFRMIELDEACGYGYENDRHVAYAAEVLTSFYFSDHKDEYCIAVTDYRFCS
ncbi:DUF4422 domain-containing protein [Candidatus Ventrimonas sp. KK005]